MFFHLLHSVDHVIIKPNTLFQLDRRVQFRGKLIYALKSLQSDDKIFGQFKQKLTLNKLSVDGLIFAHHFGYTGIIQLTVCLYLHAFLELLISVKVTFCAVE